MDHFAGLDVSVKETSVCIVDDSGKIVREAKVASEPEALLSVLKNPAYRFKRIGLEAGPLSQWLYSALAEAELPVVCVETRHMQAVLKAQINKDRPQRCARHRADDAGGALPSGACEDVAQSETADAADPSQTAAVEGDRYRERPARYFTQLRPQGWNGREGEVRGPGQLQTSRPVRYMNEEVKRPAEAGSIKRPLRSGSILPLVRAWPPRTESRATFLCARSPWRFSQGSCPCRLCGKSAAPNGDGRRDLIVRHNLHSGFLSWSWASPEEAFAPCSFGAASR